MAGVPRDIVDRQIALFEKVHPDYANGVKKALGDIGFYMEVSQEELKRYEELQVLALDFARVGKTQDLKAMLEAGMSVNLTDHKGNTLLMLASYNGNFETTKMLLEYKAEVDRKNDQRTNTTCWCLF